MDGNPKLILGMIWTLILRFTIADIRSVFGAPFQIPMYLTVAAKRACQRKRVFFSGVNAKQRRTRRSMSKTSP
jgi:hypothetical protein